MQKLKGCDFIDSKDVQKTESEPVGYIYITENLVDGRKYIGQHHSKEFDPYYKGSGKILKQAFDKYGFNNFKTTILEWCYSDEELNEKERYWIKENNAVEDRLFYNILPGGLGVQMFGPDNHMYGKHHTEEAKEKMSNALKGKMAGENNPMYGVHLTYTQEQKDKMSERNKRMGKWVGEDNPWYGKPSPFKGKKRSEEWCKKSSEAHKGIHPNISEETRARLSKMRSEWMSGEKNHWYGKRGAELPWYGRKKTPEEIEKLRQASLGKRKGKDNPASKPIYSIDGRYLFWTIQEVADFLGKTYGQARHAINHEKQVDRNGEQIIFTRDKSKVKEKNLQDELR